MNPDKETAVTRKVSLKERLDMEFWLIQKLSIVMEKANFYELPKHVVDKALSEHDTREGVQVISVISTVVPLSLIFCNQIIDSNFFPN